MIVGRHGLPVDDELKYLGGARETREFILEGWLPTIAPLLHRLCRMTINDSVLLYVTRLLLKRYLIVDSFNF